MAFGFGFPPVTFGKTYCQRPGTDTILPSFLCLSTIFRQKNFNSIRGQSPRGLTYQRASRFSSSPWSGVAPSRSRRMALTSKLRSGAWAPAGVRRQPTARSLPVSCNPTPQVRAAGEAFTEGGQSPGGFCRPTPGPRYLSPAARSPGPPAQTTPPTRPWPRRHSHGATVNDGPRAVSGAGSKAKLAERPWSLIPSCAWVTRVRPCTSTDSPQPGWCQANPPPNSTPSPVSASPPSWRRPNSTVGASSPPARDRDQPPSTPKPQLRHVRPGPGQAQGLIRGGTRPQGIGHDRASVRPWVWVGSRSVPRAPAAAIVQSISVFYTGAGGQCQG